MPRRLLPLQMPAGAQRAGARSCSALQLQLQSPVSPSPQVHLFGRGRPERFDPSGIARIGSSDLYLVINDKDDGPQLSVHRVGGGGRLEAGRAFAIDGVVINKLEAITAVPNEPNVFYVSGSFEGGFDGDADKRVLRLELARSGEGLRATATRLELFDPRAAVAATLGASWCQIEALAFSPDARLRIGLRAVGEDWTHPRYRATILDYDAHDLGAAPRLLCDVDLTPILGRPEGIAAITYAPELDAHLILTSYEPGPNDSGTGGSHLWIVPGALEGLADPQLWRRLKRVELAHKGEGITSLGDGRVLVVFDDDDDPSLAPHLARSAVIDLSPMI